MAQNSVKIKEYWLHIIAWVCFISFPVAFAISEFGAVDLKLFYRLGINAVVFYANYLILVPFLLLKKRMIPYVLSSIGLLVVVNIAVRHSMPQLPPGMEQFKEMVEAVEQQSAVKQLKYFIPVVITFAFFLLGGTIALVKDFYQRDKLVQLKEIQKTETELQFLKNQLNPHFLFNSLNSIYSLVRNKSNEAPEAVITLSELMRYMLYEAREEKVPLSKEIKYIQNYISLQRLRLLNSELVTLVIKGNYEDKQIHPLLLISFIENAFKYGTDFKGVTDIAIVIEVVGNTLIFRVNNFLGNFKKDEKSSGIGLRNIKNRLELLYPNKHSLSMKKDEKRYFVDLELNLY